MSQTKTDPDEIDRTELRRTIRTTIETSDEITKTDLIQDVLVELAVAREDVRTELAELERKGFIYTVPIERDDSPLVRIP